MDEKTTFKGFPDEPWMTQDKHPNPNNAVVCVDVVIFRETPEGRQVCTIKTDKPAFEGKYALPGGKLDANDETIIDTALREAYEETRVFLTSNDLTLVGVYSAKDRDPRFRSISVAFVADISYELSLIARHGSDSTELAWLDIDHLPALAFDHSEIVQQALESQRGKGQA